MAEITNDIHPTKLTTCLDTSAPHGVTTGALIDDRRTETRIVHKSVVMMAFGPGMHDGFEQATLVNCSLRGVGLLLSKPLPINSRFFLKIRLSSTALAVYSVRHCSHTAIGYEVGAQFSGVIGNDADGDCSAEQLLAVLLSSDDTAQK